VSEAWVQYMAKPPLTFDSLVFFS